MSNENTCLMITESRRKINTLKFYDIKENTRTQTVTKGTENCNGEKDVYYPEQNFS